MRDQNRKEAEDIEATEIEEMVSTTEKREDSIEEEEEIGDLKTMESEEDLLCNNSNQNLFNSKRR